MFTDNDAILNGQLTRRDFLRYTGVLGTAIAADLFLGPLFSAADAAGEQLQVSASRATYNLRDAIDFSGRLLDSKSRPIPNISIGVEDSIRQMSAMVGRTDSTGRFTYRINGSDNSKAGQFNLKFIAPVNGQIAKTASVAVNQVPVRARQFAEVTNKGKSRYQVDLVADGRNLGSRTITPGQKNVMLWDVSDSSTHNLKFVCTNLDNRKRFEITPAIQGITFNGPATCSAVNPTYASYNVTARNMVNNGTRTENTKTFTGTARDVYDTVANKEWALKGEKLLVNTTTKEGIGVDGGVSGGAGCSTFLGIKAECSVGCEASAGLELHLCAGACFPIQLAHQFGCGYSCGVKFAEVSCSVSASVGVQATYR